MLRHLCAPLSHTAFRCRISAPVPVPGIRSVSTYQLRIPRFPAPPPARRRFEPVVPLPTPTSSSSSSSAPTATTTTTKSTPRTSTSTSSKPERRPTNRQIPFDHVHVLDPHTNKLLSGTKQRLETLLESLDINDNDSDNKGNNNDKARAVVELVASHPEPVVRVTTWGEVEARYREIAKRARTARARSSSSSSSATVASGSEKEVRLSWGVGKADVEHKLRKARRDLEKGCRVVVVVDTKRGNRRPSGRQELVAFGDEIAGALSEAGKECKEREFAERSMTLSFRKD